MLKSIEIAVRSWFILVVLILLLQSPSLSHASQIYSSSSSNPELDITVYSESLFEWVFTNNGGSCAFEAKLQKASSTILNITPVVGSYQLTFNSTEVSTQGYYFNISSTDCFWQITITEFVDPNSSSTTEFVTSDESANNAEDQGVTSVLDFENTTSIISDFPNESTPSPNWPILLSIAIIMTIGIIFLFSGSNRKSVPQTREKDLEYKTTVMKSTSINSSQLIPKSNNCPVCGFSVAVDELFCSECGAKI